ncbi:hypothetical protein ACM66B_005314 [Microbotryomycetes sp. NB124-2]
MSSDALEADTASMATTAGSIGRSQRQRRPARPRAAEGTSTVPHGRASASSATLTTSTYVASSSTAPVQLNVSMSFSMQPGMSSLPALPTRIDPIASAPIAGPSSVQQHQVMYQPQVNASFTVVGSTYSDHVPPPPPPASALDFARWQRQQTLATSASMPAVMNEPAIGFGPTARASSAPSSAGPKPPSRRRFAQQREESSDGIIIETTAVKLVESDSDLDDFFTRKAPPGQKRLPARRPKAINRRPSPTVSDSIESSKSGSDSGSGSDSDSGKKDKDRDISVGAGRRPKLKMPAWTQRGLKEARTSNQAAEGGRNRRKRRLSIDSDEEAALEAKKALDHSQSNIKTPNEAGTKVKATSSSPESTRKPKVGKAIVSSDDDDDVVLVDSSPKPTVESNRRRSPRRRGQAAVADGPQLASAPLVDSEPIKRVNIFEILNGSSPRLPAATVDKDVLDILDTSDGALDPAKDPVRRSVAARQPASDGSIIIEDSLASTARPLEPVVQAPEEDVYISVSLVMDPDAKVSVAAKRGYERPMMFALGSRQPFEMLFEQIALARTIPSEKLVLRYDTRQIMRFGTPQSLGMFGQVQVKAYESAVWDKLEQRRKDSLLAPVERAPVASVAIREDDDDEGDMLIVPEDAAEPTRMLSPMPEELDASTDVDSSLFRITLRGSDRQSLPLAVKRTTLFSSLLNKYCKKFDVPSDRAARLRIEFDGERIDLSKRIEDYEDDVEDDSVVDIIETRA